MSKFLSLLKMACGNLKAYAWINVKMCLSFACLAFLICLFSVYNQSLTARTAETYEEAISGNYFWSETDRENLLKQYGYTGYTRYTFRVMSLTERMQTVYNDENAPSCTTKYVRLTYNGQTYSKLEGKSSYPVTLYTDNPFNDNDNRALRKLYGIDSPLIGRMPENEDEAIVAAHILVNYGIDPEEAIGKQIIVAIDGDTEPLFSATICGVIHEEYYSLIGHHNGVIYPCFILHEGNPVFNKGKVLVRYIYLFSDWFNADVEDLTELQYNRNFRYGAFGIYGQLNNLNKIQQIANTLYSIIGSALIVGLVLTIYLMIDKYLRVYSRTSGILLTLGMRRREVYRLLLIQIILICIIAIPIAVGLTAFSYSVITSIVLRITSIKMSSTVVQISSMLALGIGAVTLIALCFFVYIKHKLKKRTVKQLLNTVVS